MIDFIANCGGLLGIILGFSALTVVELVYISTLGLGCKLKRQIKTQNTAQVLIQTNQNRTISTQTEGQRFHFTRRNTII